MTDFSITTTADFDAGTKSSIVTTTDEYDIIADEIALSFPYADKDANLVSYWRFEDNPNDETGTNNGTVTGATYTSLGKFGGAYDFDADNDYISIAADPSLNFGANTDFSVSAWIYADASANNYILSSGAGGAGEGWWLFRILNNALQAGLDDGTTLVTTTGTLALQDAWHHVVATFDRDGNVTLYVDATADGSADISGIGSIDTTDDYTIGGRSVSLTYEFDGRIDEFKIYSRLLTPTEITTLYNSGNQYVASGNWASATQTMTSGSKLNDITITHSGLDASNYIDTIEILDASDDSVISTSTTNIITGASTTLTSSDFDNGFDGTLSTDFKVKIYLVGDNTTTPIITQIDGTYVVGTSYVRFDSQVWGTDTKVRFDSEAF